MLPAEVPSLSLAALLRREKVLEKGDLASASAVLAVALLLLLLPAAKKNDLFSVLVAAVALLGAVPADPSRYPLHFAAKADLSCAWEPEAIPQAAPRCYAPVRPAKGTSDDVVCVAAVHGPPHSFVQSLPRSWNQKAVPSSAAVLLSVLFPAPPLLLL